MLRDLLDRADQSEYQPLAAPVGLILLGAGNFLLPASIGPAVMVVGSALCIVGLLLTLRPTEGDR